MHFEASVKVEIDILILREWPQQVHGHHNAPSHVTPLPHLCCRCLPEARPKLRLTRQSPKSFPWCIKPGPCLHLRLSPSPSWLTKDDQWAACRGLYWLRFFHRPCICGCSVSHFLPLESRAQSVCLLPRTTYVHYTSATRLWTLGEEKGNPSCVVCVHVMWKPEVNRTVCLQHKFPLQSFYLITKIHTT